MLALIVGGILVLRALGIALVSLADTHDLDRVRVCRPHRAGDQRQRRDDRDRRGEPGRGPVPGLPGQHSGSRKLPQPALAAVVITAYLTIESAVTAFRQQTDAQWTASGQAATGKPPDIPAAPPLG